MKHQYGGKYEHASLQDYDYGSHWLVEGDSHRDWLSENGSTLGYDDDLGDWLNRNLPLLRWCAYCGDRLNGVFFHILDGEHAPFLLGDDAEGNDEWVAPQEVLHQLGEWVDPIYRLWVCLRCGFWQWCSVELHPRDGGCDGSIATSVVRDFETLLPDGCAAELGQHLARHPRNLSRLSPRHLESLVAEVYRANYAHAEVRHVGRPGDGGIDVLFIDDGNREWLIQVKRRQNLSNAEGVETVRSMLGTLLVAGRQRGIVVTTADHFSHSAHDAVRRAKASSRGLITDIELVDRHLLLRLMGSLIPTNDWLKPLREGKVCTGANIAPLEEWCICRLNQMRNRPA